MVSVALLSKQARTSSLRTLGTALFRLVCWKRTQYEQYAPTLTRCEKRPLPDSKNSTHV